LEQWEGKMSARNSMRTIGIILLVGAVGFVVYGQTLPSNPPDLVVGGAIALIGMTVSFLVGAIFLFGSLLLPKDRNPDG
jgi:hypothetical protein